MPVVFLWPSCPNGKVSVPGRRAVSKNGAIVPGRKRWDAQFVDGRYSTGDGDAIAAIRRAMRTARGQIHEMGEPPQAGVTLEATEETLGAALERLLKAMWRDEELDAL